MVEIAPTSGAKRRGGRWRRPVSGDEKEAALLSALACLLFLFRKRDIHVNREALHEAMAKEGTLDIDAAVRCGRQAGLSIDTSVLIPKFVHL